MRRVLITLAILSLVLMLPTVARNNDVHSNPAIDSPIRLQSGFSATSEASGEGSALTGVEYQSRRLEGQQLEILNSYANTALHYGNIDLTEYLVPSWSIYEVDIDVNSITAAPEREIVGQTLGTYDFKIDYVAGTYYSQLAQGFYEQPFNGSLLNYSIYYSTAFYNPDYRGNASFVISSDFQSFSSVMTTPVNVTASESTPTWATLLGESIALDADSVYWAVINGSTLYAGGSPIEYPKIYWLAEDNPGTFASYWRGLTAWDSKPFEGIMNYTYVPWDRVADSPLTFGDPEAVSLTVNSSSMTGMAWSFVDETYNITRLEFESNQSVYVDYTMTIWYREDVNLSTSWSIAASGQLAEWYASVALDYPSFPGAESKALNVTVPADWSPTGLYNSTYPESNYGHFSKSDNVVICTNIDDETWTLVCNAPNYVTSVALSDDSTENPITDYVANTVDIDIDVEVQDGLSNPVTGGLTNLTVLDSLNTVYAPSELPASSGSVSFLWDIDATTTGNGTHSLEIFWTNGVEAGYRAIVMFVYYSTTLLPDSSEINAFAEDNFYISVNFARVSPATGLDGLLGADVTYTFGTAVNVSMIDQAGGSWDATISTAGMTNGTYPLYIYAEGYALENRSLTIPVHLTYETQALTVTWSNTNNISYLETTTLTIDYNATGGAIPDAVVNVTFQGSTYTMIWDPVSEYYWIELTGSDFVDVPGTFSLNVSAWKLGYQPQYDDTIQITVRAQTGLLFDAEWIPSRTDLTFIDQLEIRVRYEYNSNPILTATVRVTFNGSQPVDLIYNSTSLRWEITLFCSDYLGSWEITAHASADGYTAVQEMQPWTINEDIASLTPSWEDFCATTDYATAAPLTITLLDSMGIPVNDAAISLWVYGTSTNMTFVADGVYTIQIVPEANRGVFLVQVTLTEYGFTADSLLLNLTVQATTTLEVNHLLSEFEQWNLTISAIYRDSVYETQIIDAIVNVTVGGNTYTLTYTGSYYVVEIVLNLAPDSYTIYCSASEEFAVTATSATPFTVLAKEKLDLTIGFSGNLIAGQLIEVRATLTSNETGLPISNALVIFEVSIRFTNGTIAQLVEGTMSDLTNNEGVASIGIQVPEGHVESLSVQAFYEGSRTRWAVSASRMTEVQVNVLSLLLAFFMSDVGIMIIGSLVILGVVAAAYNRTVKPRKKAAKMSLESQLRKFRDLQTIQHFMAVYLDRGTCVFYHPFRHERIEPDLISGFISAITSVYGEIKGDGVRGTLEEIQYHGLRLNSYSGKFIIGILILEGEMTPLLRDRLQFFVELFENQYEQDLDRWNGATDCFDPEWVVSTLNSAFNYSWHLPHRFGPTRKVSKTDAKILDYIGAVRDEHGEFYLKELLKPLSEMLGRSEAVTLDRLLSLQERGAIVPLGVQTILQRQGMGLAAGEGLGEITLIEMPEVLETEKLDEPTEEPVQEEESQVEEEPTSEVVTPAEDEVGTEEETVDETAIMVEEELEEEEVGTDEESDPLDAFVEDVETLLQDDSEPEEEPEDDLDKFVKDVESLLSEDKKESDD